MSKTSKKGVSVTPDLIEQDIIQEEPTMQTEQPATPTMPAFPSNWFTMSAKQQMAWFQEQQKSLAEAAKREAEAAKREAEAKAAQQKVLFAQIADVFQTGMPVEDMEAAGVSSILIKKNEQGEWIVEIRNGAKHTGSGLPHSGGKGKTDLPLGTTLTRKYKGATYTLTATEQGLVVDGIGTFSSLTAAAKAIAQGSGELNGKAWWGYQG